MKKTLLLIGGSLALGLAAINFCFSSSQSKVSVLTLQNVEALALLDFDDGELPGGFVEGMSAGTRKEPVQTPNGWEWQDVPCCKSSNPHSACNMMGVGPC